MDGCPAVWPPGELDGFGGRGVQLGVHSRHLAVPTHTKCLGLIVPFIQIRKLRPREG